MGQRDCAATLKQALSGRPPPRSLAQSAQICRSGLLPRRRPAEPASATATETKMAILRLRRDIIEAGFHITLVLEQQLAQECAALASFYFLLVHTHDYTETRRIGNRQ